MLKEFEPFEGCKMMSLAEKLWPINRSITGQGVRDTLTILKEHLPNLKICEIESGTKVFDWVVPNEWQISEAYIEDEYGNKIIDIKNNNLHIVSYSISIDTIISLENLQEHLYSLPHLPDAIPYVTSYYESNWGFCLPHSLRSSLKNIQYHVVIKSTHFKGFLNYGELLIKGEYSKEIFLSTYICHPSMANNELSGPVLTVEISKWIENLKNKKFSFRIIFIPETIGSLSYLFRNLNYMKQNVIAGYNITCVGDEAEFSFLPSRSGDTLSDRAALIILENELSNFKKYSWLERGSDERQYCAPGIDLPVSSIMRSKYGEYFQYHTSLDNLSFITSKGLSESLEIYKKVILCILSNCYPKINILGEPHLSKRNLYPTISTLEVASKVKSLMNFISFCDGKNDLIAISKLINVPFSDVLILLESLKCHDILDITYEFDSI